MNDKEYYDRLRKEMEHLKQHRRELEKKFIPDQTLNKAKEIVQGADQMLSMTKSIYKGSCQMQPPKKISQRKLTAKTTKKPVVHEHLPITDDDILNVRIAAETSEDVLDFIRKV